jgi:hypothetical protein
VAATGSGLPPLVANDDISEVGARPLVTDPKLGWETHVQMAGPIDGSHTRLARDPTDVTDYRIRSGVRWVVVSLVVALLVGAMIVLFLEI